MDRGKGQERKQRETAQRKVGEPQVSACAKRPREAELRESKEFEKQNLLGFPFKKNNKPIVELKDEKPEAAPRKTRTMSVVV